MRLFLTGGTGFVGSHFINVAHAAGHEIVALRRPGSRARVALTHEPRWVDGTLDEDHGADFAGIDVVIHLASHTPNPPYDSLEKCLYWNVFASVQLARQAVAAGIQRFVIAGSCFEYGRAAERHEFIPPDAALEPSLSYPTSKAAASVAFLGLAREHALRLQVMRIFQVFGEGEQATRLWPSLRQASIDGRNFPMSPGAQVRDFVEVTDVARQLVESLEFEGVEPGEPVVRHVASGRAQTLLEFASTWWSHWQSAGKLVPGAVPYRQNEIMRLVPAMRVRSRRE